MGRLVDLTGQRFGKLVVLGRTENRITPKGKSLVRWKCQCDCGRETDSDSWSLTHGKKTSCGCTAHDLLSASMRRTHERHPEIAKNFKSIITKNGESQTRLYKIWRGMKSRCNDVGCAGYKNYGGRGIRVCEEWERDFLSFKEWALSHGYVQDAQKYQCTIDRIDVDGDYCPENCRWATFKEQQRNRRTNHRVTYNDETHTISEWAKILGVSPNTLYSRLGWLGWTAEQALSWNGAEMRRCERMARVKEEHI